MEEKSEVQEEKTEGPRGMEEPRGMEKLVGRRKPWKKDKEEDKVNDKRKYLDKEQKDLVMGTDPILDQKPNKINNDENEKLEEEEVMSLFRNEEEEELEQGLCLRCVYMPCLCTLYN